MIREGLLAGLGNTADGNGGGLLGGFVSALGCDLGCGLGLLGVRGLGLAAERLRRDGRPELGRVILVPLLEADHVLILGQRVAPEVLGDLAHLVVGGVEVVAQDDGVDELLLEHLRHRVEAVQPLHADVAAGLFGVLADHNCVVQALHLDGRREVGGEFLIEGPKGLVGLREFDRLALKRCSVHCGFLQSRHSRPHFPL